MLFQSPLDQSDHSVSILNFYNFVVSSTRFRLETVIESDSGQVEVLLGVVVVVEGIGWRGT